MSTKKMPKIWITYAWVDNEEGDFSYLVQVLRDSGVIADFDKIALVPGKKLWDQIASKITEGEYNGWAYMLWEVCSSITRLLTGVACASCMPILDRRRAGIAKAREPALTS